MIKNRHSVHSLHKRVYTIKLLLHTLNLFKVGNLILLRRGAIPILMQWTLIYFPVMKLTFSLIHQKIIHHSKTYLLSTIVLILPLKITLALKVWSSSLQEIRFQRKEQRRKKIIQFILCLRARQANLSQMSFKIFRS